MKKIILLFFTFLGICCCLAQPTKTIDTVNAKKDAVLNTLLLKTDTLTAKKRPEIEIKGFEPGHVKVQLMSSAGKLLREEKRLVLIGNENIVFMFSEKPGFYFLFLKQGKIMLKSKLVIH